MRLAHYRTRENLIVIGISGYDRNDRFRRHINPLCQTADCRQQLLDMILFDAARLKFLDQFDQ
jgi:hypothetical protein